MYSPIAVYIKIWYGFGSVNGRNYELFQDVIN